MALKGRFHSYESFAAADGPGVRFVGFLSGCRWRCAYCHNPDTWARPPAFEASAEEVLERALRYRDYWRGEGGITLSGGEPLLQPEFAAELFGLAKAAGVNTCLDTAGGPFVRGERRFDELFGLVDTVLLDLKAMDPRLHRELTGADNRPVLALAEYLGERKINVWIRHVVVSGVTDGEEEMAKIRAFAAKFPNVSRVEMLPYHELGVPKYAALGLEYRIEPAGGGIFRVRNPVR